MTLPERARAASDETAVSEVIGFLTTFAIVSFLLIVAMLAFSDAQGRATQRVADVQAESVAQRVATVAIDLALYDANGGAADVAIAVELPLDLAGRGYQVRLCGDAVAPCDDPPCDEACPFVRVDSGSTRADQSMFLGAGAALCAGAVANGGLAYVTYDASAGCIGLSNQVSP